MEKRRVPAQRRSQELVDSILTATSIVVDQSGIDGATVDKIATKAGVSVGSIYQYFSNKTAIFFSFGERHLESNRSRMFARLEEWQHLPICELIPKVIDDMTEQWESRSKAMRYVFVYANALGLRARQMKMRREVIERLAAVLERHRGELRVKDPHLAAAAVIHAAVAVITAKYLDPDLPFEMSQLKEELREMVSAYLLKPESLSPDLKQI